MSLFSHFRFMLLVHFLKSGCLYSYYTLSLIIPCKQSEQEDSKFNWKKKTHTHVYGVKEFVCCLSVMNLTSITSRTGKLEWAEIFYMTSLSKSVVPKNYINASHCLKPQMFLLPITGLHYLVGSLHSSDDPWVMPMYHGLQLQVYNQHMYTLKLTGI